MQIDAPRVLQMRLVVEADDYDDAVHFFRDVLGLREEGSFSGPNDARVAILDAGRATLEIANPAQKRMIDEVEVGRSVAPRLRVAFEVADSRSATDDLVAAGAELIAEPVETPWRSLNSRLARARRPPDHALPGARRRRPSRPAREPPAWRPAPRAAPGRSSARRRRTRDTHTPSPAHHAAPCPRRGAIRRARRRSRPR